MLLAEELNLLNIEFRSHEKQALRDRTFDRDFPSEEIENPASVQDVLYNSQSAHSPSQPPGSPELAPENGHGYAATYFSVSPNSSPSFRLDTEKFRKILKASRTTNSQSKPASRLHRLPSVARLQSPQSAENSLISTTEKDKEKVTLLRVKINRFLGFKIVNALLCLPGK